ncbi:MAG: heavy metal-associated domain-containing protein [Nitrospiraceae bacterium]|nr:heavy metal-associated domain-containing protein [Nitrospiraceae bacterium]MDA8327273.1 heavy metal-associated domain-containing protein [Nitrospiraceae bacterium]
MPEKLEIKVPREMCTSCSLALERFLGKMEGVGSIDTETDKIIINYDNGKISRQELLNISKMALEKLGYPLI